MNILLTGGAGYIGTHICVKLIEQGYTPIVIDNFVNSSMRVFKNVEKITGQEIKLYKGDVRDKELLQTIFKENSIYAVIHLAGFKYVGESVELPFMYYHTNLVSTLTLLGVMAEHKCFNLIFSSSCTVYGTPECSPVKEDYEGTPTSPYGRTKYFQEQMLMDICKSSELWNIVSLRYSNPIGSHESGLIGDHPCGKPNTLMAYMTGVVSGEYDKLSVFGNDYDTADGTCIRDYIHIDDLSNAHVASIHSIKKGYHAYNISTGNPTSVLEMIGIFEKATGENVKYEFTDRRDGDAGVICCDPSLAMDELKWKPEHTLEEACVSALKFERYVKNELNRYDDLT